MVGIVRLATLITNDYTVNGKRVARLTFSLQNLRKVFGNDRAVNITTDRILAYTAKRLECPKCQHPIETHDASHTFQGVAPSTVNRELAALGRMFALAKKARKVAHVPAIDKLKENNTRQGFFSEAEMLSVIGTFPSIYVACLKSPTSLAGGRRVR